MKQASKANTCKKPCKQKIATKRKSENESQSLVIPSGVASFCNHAIEQLDEPNHGSRLKRCKKWRRLKKRNKNMELPPSLFGKPEDKENRKNM